jgi:hypothetical protein
MADNMIHQLSKKTWYRWSFYINIILFFIIGLFIYLLIRDSYLLGLNPNSDMWFAVARDVAFLAVAFALIFFQFFRNLLVIMRRSY